MHRLTRAEIATIVAALLYWQQTFPRGAMAVQLPATLGREVPLDRGGIRALIEEFVAHVEMYS